MLIIEKIVNLETNEEILIEREETKEETATRELFESEQAVKAANKTAKATAKANLLAKLGITEEEAKLLLS